MVYLPFWDYRSDMVCGRGSFGSQCMSVVFPGAQSYVGISVKWLQYGILILQLLSQYQCLHICVCTCIYIHIHVYVLSMYTSIYVGTVIQATPPPCILPTCILCLRFCFEMGRGHGISKLMASAIEKMSLKLWHGDVLAKHQPVGRTLTSRFRASRGHKDAPWKAKYL